MLESQLSVWGPWETPNTQILSVDFDVFWTMCISNKYIYQVLNVSNSSDTHALFWLLLLTWMTTNPISFCNSWCIPVIERLMPDRTCMLCHTQLCSLALVILNLCILSCTSVGYSSLLLGSTYLLLHIKVSILELSHKNEVQITIPRRISWVCVFISPGVLYEEAQGRCTCIRNNQIISIFITLHQSVKVTFDWHSK